MQRNHISIQFQTKGKTDIDLNGKIQVERSRKQSRNSTPETYVSQT